jgi:hypothetical protein
MDDAAQVTKVGVAAGLVLGGMVVLREEQVEVFEHRVDELGWSRRDIGRWQVGYEVLVEAGDREQVRREVAEEPVHEELPVPVRETVATSTPRSTSG